MKNWKLKLRYGKERTSYKHFTLLAPVLIRKYIEDFNAQPGTAYIGMKVWAENSNAAVDILNNIGSQVGYEINGNIEIYNSEPVNRPSENPNAYDINFSYYSG